MSSSLLRASSEACSAPTERGFICCREAISTSENCSSGLGELESKLKNYFGKLDAVEPQVQFDEGASQ